MSITIGTTGTLDLAVRTALDYMVDCRELEWDDYYDVLYDKYFDLLKSGSTFQGALDEVIEGLDPQLSIVANYKFWGALNGTEEPKVKPKNAWLKARDAIMTKS